MKRAGVPWQVHTSVPPEFAPMFGVMVTTANCVELSPLMMITPVVGLTVPPITLPTELTVSVEIVDDASEICPVPADCTASEIEVLNPEAARINSDTRARTV